VRIPFLLEVIVTKTVEIATIATTIVKFFFDHDGEVDRNLVNQILPRVSIDDEQELRYSTEAPTKQGAFTYRVMKFSRSRPSSGSHWAL